MSVEKELLEQIKKLQDELESLKKEIKDKEKNEDKIIEKIDFIENLIRKLFSVAEGAVIGSLEGIKKGLKEK